jgi:hypothetical protein
VQPDDHSAAIVCMPILSGPLTDFAPPVVLRYKAGVDHRASSLSLPLYDMFRSPWFDDLIDRVDTFGATRPQNFLPCVSNPRANPFCQNFRRAFQIRVLTPRPYLRDPPQSYHCSLA